MEQWNVNPPVLYLWSHKAWSQRHRIIAEQRGHTSRDQKEPYPASEDQAQESHKHQIHQPDHNMRDGSGSSKQKRRRERPMRAKMAKKMRVAQRSGGSWRRPPPQESSHSMHKHNSFSGPSNPVRVNFTEDSYSCGLNRHNCFEFDARAMIPTPAEERFPRGPFIGPCDPRMGAMPMGVRGKYVGGQCVM
ncbi:hypothetical protein QJS10_CPA10g01896 [Acorus calamus]|uniref:Uncharacterized protein n=1 Tax=Acorus calamus TaxID=4465 RepID=A0AAV9DZF5_ACOCL|nr:hypothetical protein QJS10_CPA10g01896 [Acorus calamus]